MGNLQDRKEVESQKGDLQGEMRIQAHGTADPDGGKSQVCTGQYQATGKCSL